VGIIEDRSSRYSELVFADALESPFVQAYYVLRFAARTLNRIRPAQFFQKCAALFIRGITRHEISESHGPFSRSKACREVAKDASAEVGSKPKAGIKGEFDGFAEGLTRPTAPARAEESARSGVRYNRFPVKHAEFLQADASLGISNRPRLFQILKFSNRFPGRILPAADPSSRRLPLAKPDILANLQPEFEGHGSPRSLSGEHFKVTGKPSAKRGQERAAWLFHPAADLTVKTWVKIIPTFDFLYGTKNADRQTFKFLRCQLVWNFPIHNASPFAPESAGLAHRKSVA